MTQDTSREVAVVDDDPDVLDSYRFVLELAGLSVGTYASALEYLASVPPYPRCLILDHHMPEMSGLDLAQRLRAEGVKIPVLLITAAPSPAIVARANALGVVRVLEKPPAEDDLLNFVAASSTPTGATS